METKTCTKCKRSLPKSDVYFRKHKQCKEGIYSQCKECEGKFFTDIKTSVKTIPKDGMKTCSKCKTKKNLEEFGKEKRNKDGRRSDCKECNKLVRSKWIDNNANYFKEWHNKNPEYRRDTYLKNIEREKENNKKWRTNNKEKAHEKVIQRRQLEQNSTYNFTNEDWLKALAYFKHSCAYCGETEKELQKEHFIPLIKGGAFIPSNIIPACYSCNASKRDRVFEVWYPKQSNYAVERYERILQFIGIENNVQQLSIL